MLGIEELSEMDRRIVVRARKLQRYLTQPFHVTAELTGIQGASVSLADTLLIVPPSCVGSTGRVPRSMLHRASDEACGHEVLRPPFAGCNALRADRIEVTSFVGQDDSGLFQDLADHIRMMTVLAFGLARYRTTDDRSHSWLCRAACSIVSTTTST